MRVDDGQDPLVHPEEARLRVDDFQEFLQREANRLQIAPQVAAHINPNFRPARIQPDWGPIPVFDPVVNPADEF